MSFVTYNNLGEVAPTDQFQPAVQEMEQNIKNLVWLIIIIAVVALLWMALMG